MLKMYLAGAIRDSHPKDTAWRDEMSTVLGVYLESGDLRILNPLGGNTIDRVTGDRKMSGIPIRPRNILNQDFWCVDQADIVVFNFEGLAEGHPCIGTITEFGRSTMSPKMRYSIVPNVKSLQYQHQGMSLKLHPFIEECSSEIFETVEECERFLYQHIPVLAGINPWCRSYPSQEQWEVRA